LIGGDSLENWHQATYSLHEWAGWGYIDILNMEPYQIEYYLALKVKTEKEKQTAHEEQMKRNK